MKHLTFWRLIWIYIFLFWAIIAFGAYENYQNDPLRGCVPYNITATWKGYHCASGDIYAAN